MVPTCARRRQAAAAREGGSTTSSTSPVPLMHQLSDGSTRAAPLLRAGSSTSSTGSLLGGDGTPHRKSQHKRSPHLSDISSASEAPASSGEEYMDTACSDVDDVDADDEGDAGERRSLLADDRPRQSLGLLQRRWHAERRKRQEQQRMMSGSGAVLQKTETAGRGLERRDLYGRARVQRKAFDEFDDDPSDSTEMDMGSVCACVIIGCAALVWCVGGVSLLLGSALYMQNMTLAQSWEQLQVTRARNLGVDVSQL